MKLPSWLVSGALKVIDKAAHDPKVQAKALEVLVRVTSKAKPAGVQAPKP